MINKNRFHFIAGVFLLITLLFAGNVLSAPIKKISKTNAPPDTGSIAKIARAIDGDTFVLTNGMHIRGIGIDTPEENEPFYKEAKAYAESTLVGKEVKLEFDKETEDNYGRKLVYIFDGTFFFNESIIRAGLGRLYRFKGHDKYISKLINAQNDARKNKIGIWSLPAPKKEEFYISIRDSYRFHRPLCPAIKQANLAKALHFKTRDEALDKGLSPCRQCRP